MQNKYNPFSKNFPEILLRLFGLFLKIGSYLKFTSPDVLTRGKRGDIFLLEKIKRQIIYRNENIIRRNNREIR